MENLPGKDGHYKLRDQVNWITPKQPSGGGCPRNTPGGGLRKLEDQTEVNWLTVTAQDAKNNAGPSQFDRNTYPLNVAVQDGLPGPDSPSTNGKSRELWPTPYGLSADQGQGQGEFQKAITKYGKGKLNPAWVEQLMGLPAGWTDLDSSETASCLNVQKKQLES